VIQRTYKKREKHDLKRMQFIKEELNKSIENLRRKNQMELQEIKSSYSQRETRVNGHSSRLEQVEDSILELKDLIKIKERTEDILVKQIKSH
jgi:hypothetical protein